MKHRIATEPEYEQLKANNYEIMHYELVATTYAGLEEVLARELIDLGANEVQPVRRAVNFTGNTEMIYRANFSLRTALRVLVTLRSFKIFKVDDLYHQASKVHWEDYFDAGKTFAVQSTVFSDLFKNSMFASLKLKDAIVDRFRRIDGKRPSVDTNRPEVVVNLHLANDVCTLSLDSSGYSLHKRGYRVAGHEAPISEVLAAGLLRLSGWTGKEALTDPMCGSGTIAIEAAMIAKHILPGEVGRTYAFQHWEDYRPKLFEKIQSENEHVKPDFFIYGSDNSKASIDKAGKNAKGALIADLIRFEVADFRSLQKKPESSFLLFNPPYGERLNPGDDTFYDMIGERLKHNFTGAEAWIISTDACFKSIGLKPSRKIPLYNGALQCSFRKFELFKGKKQNPQQE